jgi:hypothetical protein
MPIATTCPHCDTKLRAPDAAAGKKIRCPKCQGTVPVSAPVADNDEAVQAVPPRRKSLPSDEKPKTRNQARPAPEEEDEPVSRRSRKRPRKVKSASLPLLLGIGGVVVMLLIAGGGLIWWLTRDKASSSPITESTSVAQEKSTERGGQPGSEISAVIAKTADEFDAEWKKDRNAFTARYQSSYAQVTGVIRRMEFPDMTVVAVVLQLKGNETSGFACFTADTEPWTKVSIGQQVTLKGHARQGRDAQIARGPTLEGCTFVDLTPNPVPVVTADQLVKEYQSDARAATARYNGKLIILTGTVSSSENKSGSTTIVVSAKGNILLTFVIVVSALPIPQSGQEIKVLLEVGPYLPDYPAKGLGALQLAARRLLK